MAKAWLRALCVAAVCWSSLPAQAEGPKELRSKLEQVRKDSKLPAGVFTSIEHVIEVSEKIERGFPEQSVEWAARAKHYLELAQRGEDPYPAERGRIVSRGYRSPIS